MRVLHVINALSVGGAERFLLQLAPAQARRGCQPSILTLVEPNPLADLCAARGVGYRCLGRKRLNDPRLVADVWRALRDLRPDVVHTHLFYADTFGSVAARAAGVRAVMSTQHSTQRGQLSWRRRAGIRTMARFAHRVVAVSDAVRRSAAAHLGTPESLITVIPNGITLEEWETAAAVSRVDLGIPEDALVVGCVGRVVEAKGYEAFLQVIARLADPRVCVLMVGDGPDRQRLENASTQLGLASTVRWLGFRQDVPRILKTLDVFAMPSLWEGHSVALLEAMAAGCACLVSDIPELAETAGTAAARVRPGDLAAMARTLQELLASPELRRDLGQAAKRIARNFSIDRAAERYLRVYQDLLRASE
jgi:glycosyltransferase involved in cell wall biosynthesis